MRRIFWDDPYKTECEAVVTKIDGNKVYLDQTVFFAFSGGQESDSGSINGVSVQEAVSEGEYIYYIVESPMKEGDKVRIEIDWEKRFKIMRLHSAAHIVYYLLTDKIGKHELIGSNITHQKSRLDFLYEKSISEFIPEMQEKVNGIIEKGLDIKIYDDPANPGRRLWELEGFEPMACGGTHLKNTREIGRIKLKRNNIGAGKERVEITLI